MLFTLSKIFVTVSEFVVVTVVVVLVVLVVVVVVFVVVVVVVVVLLLLLLLLFKLQKRNGFNNVQQYISLAFYRQLNSF